MFDFHKFNLEFLQNISSRVSSDGPPGAANGGQEEKIQEGVRPHQDHLEVRQGLYRGGGHQSPGNSVRQQFLCP